METKQIVTWLRDQAKRMPEEVYKRGIIQAADKLEELARLKAAMGRLGEFGRLFLDYQGCPRGPHGPYGSITMEQAIFLMPQITDVDGGKWIPVDADALHKYVEIKKGMEAELKKAAGCGACKSCKVDYLEEPCFSCMQDPNYPGWEWNGGGGDGP